jgi:uncharacterized protein HemX
MKSFLFLLIILLAAGTAFEVYTHLQDQAAYQTKRADLNEQIDKLTKQHQDLVDQNASLSHELNEQTQTPGSAPAR